MSHISKRKREKPKETGTKIRKKNHLMSYNDHANWAIFQVARSNLYYKVKANSRNLGQRSLLARKGTLLKKGHQKSPPFPIQSPF